MTYLLLLYGDEARWAKMSQEETARTYGAYFAYTRAMRDAGAYVEGDPLEPSTTATTVRVADGKTAVLDGPYADTKEQLGGYYKIDVANLDEAISWAARCPAASHGTVEVRPVMPVTAPV